ncbi:MAG: Fis family transcriptional regulator [Deltaproteobacteria bacterium]|nr:MAG: Fis family transcriptional regulator [Deltaproteobacteria bacterium]
MTDEREKQPEPVEPFLERASPERFEAVLASISDGVFTVDKNWRITCFNRAAEEITGYRREEVMGRYCHEILKANICREACALRYTMDTGNRVGSLVVEITARDGTVMPVSISTALFRNKQGQIIGGVESFRDLRQLESLRKQVENDYRFEDIIAKSEGMRKVLEIVPTVAVSESNVLICGESGTGKELVARAIHNLSRRQQGPFVAFNCANYPDTLIEAELFGHEKGAFTGATRARRGLFARAERGTLFLDEIGDLPLVTQAKLLRVLQEKTYEPIGSSRTEKSDARIVAATNRDLEAMVAGGSFRRDLYYRINVIRLEVPPLRERLEDVPLLVKHFLGKLTAIHDKYVEGVDSEVMRVLMNYEYPGNVRELENIVERGFVLCPGPLIQRQHLPEHLRKHGGDQDGDESLDDCERRVIMNALKKNGFNRLAAARHLGMHKSTLFRKIKRLGLELPTADGRSTLRQDGE